MVRGIEGSPVFTDDRDRADFVDRLARLSVASGSSVFAWALMTNHAHLLVKSGNQGLSAFMRKLLTGYAISKSFPKKRTIANSHQLGDLNFSLAFPAVSLVFQV